MCIGRFIGCLVVAILFGLNGLFIFSEEGFFNCGFIIMTLLSIPSLFVSLVKIE